MSNENRSREYNPNEDIGEIIDVETDVSPEEGSPEESIESAISAIEAKDNVDTSVPSGILEGAQAWIGERWEGGKEWLGDIKQEKDAWIAEHPKTAYAGKLGLDASRVGVFFGFKVVKDILKSLYKFTKTAIMKKGKISISEGWKIGMETFDSSNKKEKK